MIVLKTSVAYAVYSDRTVGSIICCMKAVITNRATSSLNNPISSENGRLFDCRNDEEAHMLIWESADHRRRSIVKFI